MKPFDIKKLLSSTAIMDQEKCQPNPKISAKNSCNSNTAAKKLKMLCALSTQGSRKSLAIPESTKNANNSNINFTQLQSVLSYFFN